MHIDDSGVDAVVRRIGPDLLQDFAARVGFAGVGDKKFEEAEFHAGQAYALIFARNLTFVEVNFEVADSDDVGALALSHFLVTFDGTSEHGFDTCFQFAGAERFDDIVVGTYFQALDAILDVGDSGQA